MELHSSRTEAKQTVEVEGLHAGEWAQQTIDFDTSKLSSIDEVRFLLPPDAELLIDDVLLCEPN